MGDRGFRVFLRTVKLTYYSACYVVIFQVQCIRLLSSNWSCLKWFVAIMAFDVLCYILMFVVIIDIMELNGGIMGGICMHDAVYFFCCRILKQDSFVFGTWPVYSSKVQMMPAAL